MSIKPMSITEILGKYYAKQYISDIDFQNILILHDDLDGKSRFEVMKQENAYFNSIGCTTKTKRLLHELKTLKKGLLKFIDDFGEKRVPDNSAFKFNIEKYVEEAKKALYAKEYIAYIEKMIENIKENKALVGQLLDNPENFDLIDWIVTIALNYNIILGYKTYNKEYYERVLNDAKLLKEQQEERDRDYSYDDPNHISGNQRVNKDN